MAKVWRDANEVVKMVHELQDNLKPYDKQMTEKPKKWDNKDNHNQKR